MGDSKPSVTAAVVASTLPLRDDPMLGHLVDLSAQTAIEATVRRTIPIFGALLDHVPRAILRRASFAVERLISSSSDYSLAATTSSPEALGIRRRPSARSS